MWWMRRTTLSGFYEQTRWARKVVVVDLGFLGDSLHLVPALWEIRDHYPQSKLHVLSSPVGAEVIGLAPCVDRLWPVELAPGKRTWREQWRIVRALRREQFDVAFNFGGSDRTIIMTALTAARWRVAHAAGRDHFWNRWLIANWVPRRDPDLAVFEQRRQVLAACGFELEPPRFDLKLDEGSQNWAAARIPLGAVHLSLNSANPLKEWPLEHHVVLLKSLWNARSELRVMVSAAARERERERLQQLAETVHDARLQVLSEKLSIAQLAGVLKRCRLHIGPDSGVLHLALALGVPTISFFRAHGGYRAWLPRGAAHRVISAPCTCIDHHEAPCERLGRAECLARIQPAQVAEVVCEQLKT
jgi:ADP-heptose:LPS heptosyltransferase